ncbi:unnamed protein product [Peniophora sp. CBMAI 1063]|nr:unnamed protein product [Peniophora sp. CBMAI 1063]
MAVADILLARPHTCKTSISNPTVNPPFMTSKFVPEPWLPAQAKDSRPSTSSSFVTARPDSPKHDLLDVDHDIAPSLEREHPSPPPSVVPVEPDWLARLDKLPTSIPASTSATTDRLAARHTSGSVVTPPPPSTSAKTDSHAPDWLPSRSNGTTSHDDVPPSASSDKRSPSAPNGQTRDQPAPKSTNGSHAVPPSLRPGYTSVKASAPLPADSSGARRAEAPQASSIAQSTSNVDIHGAPHGSISTSDPSIQDDSRSRDDLPDLASASNIDTPSSAAKSSAHTATHAPTSSASSLPPTHKTYQLHDSPGQMPAPLGMSVEEKGDAGSPATQLAQPPADSSSLPKPDELTPAKSRSEPIAIPNSTPLPVSALPAHIRPSTSAGPSPISPVPRASSLAPRPVSSAGPPSASSSPRVPARTATTPRLSGLPTSPRFTFSGGSARLSPAILPRPSAQSIFPLPSIPKTPSSAPPPLSPERQRTQSLRHMPSLLRQGAAQDEDDIATHDNAMLDGLEEDDEDGEVETEGEGMTDGGAGSGDGNGSDDGEDSPEQQTPDRSGRKGLTLRMPALKSPLSLPTAPGKSPFGFSFDRKAEKDRARERERESDGDKTPVPVRGFVDYFSSKPPEQEPMTPKTPRLSLSIKTPGLGMGAKTPGITSPKKSGAKTPGIPSAALGNGMTTPTQTGPPPAATTSSPPPPPQWVPLAPPTPASPGARADIWANSLLSSGHSEHASKIARQQARVVPMPEGDEGLSASPRPRPSFYHQPSRSMVDMTAVARAKVEPATPASPARPAPGSEAPAQTDDGVLGPSLKRQRSLPTFGPHAEPPPYPTFARGGPLPAPREDEGSERLPGYRNDIYLAGVLPRKMEFTAPGVQAKDRKWRRVLCVLEGTAFKIYALPIGKGGGSVLGGLWEKAVGAGDIAESPARASEVAALTAQKRRERELEREREREALANKAEERSSVEDTDGAGSSTSGAGTSGNESPGGRSTSRLLGSSFLRGHRGSTSSRTSLSSANTTDRTRASMDEMGGRSSSSNMRRLSVGASATSSARTSFSNTRTSPTGSAGTGGASRVLPASSSSSIAGSNSSIAPSGTTSSVNSVTHIRRRTGPEPAPSSPSTSSPGPATDPTRPLFHEPAKDVPRPEEGTLIREYSLQNAESGLASDYVKRRNVIRLRMEGEQFLIQASDVGSVVDWIEGFQAAANISLDLDERPMPRGPLFPRRRRRRPAARPTEADANPPPTMPHA